MKIAMRKSLSRRKEANRPLLADAVCSGMASSGSARNRQYKRSPSRFHRTLEQRCRDAARFAVTVRCLLESTFVPVGCIQNQQNFLSHIGNTTFAAVRRILSSSAIRLLGMPRARGFIRDPMLYLCRVCGVHGQIKPALDRSCGLPYEQRCRSGCPTLTNCSIARGRGHVSAARAIHCGLLPLKRFASCRLWFITEPLTRPTYHDH